MKSIGLQQFSNSMKTFLDKNAIYLTSLRSPREIRCYFCKSSTDDVSVYLNHNSIGEAFLLCSGCHAAYQTPQHKSVGR